MTATKAKATAPTAPVAIDKQVQSFLKNLGSGPNKIAENLAEQKIKGTIGDSEDCPMVKTIKKNFKNLKGVDVGVGSEISFSYKNEDYTIPAPAAVERFIEKFDSGDYPNLATKKSLANAS